MNWKETIKKDFQGNRHNSKGLVFIVFFRLSGLFVSSNILIKIIGFPIRVTYKFFVQWVLGIDIPDKTKIGGGFSVWHGQGLVIHEKSVIGEFVTARHNTTIGQKHDDGGAPVIGDRVNIGTQCIIIGDIIIGDNSTIGAGTIVNKNVPPNSVVYGNPFIIKPVK